MYTCVLHRRLVEHVEPQMLDEQCAFRPGRNISDCISTIQRVAEAKRQAKEPLWIAFIDIKKAYDSLPRAALFEILRKFYKVDEGLVRAIEALYTYNIGVVVLDGHTSVPFSLNTGVKQGCIMSPTLFAVYMDFILRQSMPVLREHGV